MRTARHPRWPFRPARAAWLGWGALASAVYLGAVLAAGPLPGPLLYDGLVPLPPYRWVHPPAGVARDNQPPTPVEQTLTIGPQGSPASEVATDDDQGLVTFPAGVIAPRSGESSVKVKITPLDPVTVAPAPRGQPYDGNAYRFEATYASSGAPVALTAPVTIVLRYAVHATRMLRHQGSGWVTLPVTRYDGSQQVLANSDGLGVFVAATGAPAAR